MAGKVEALFLLCISLSGPLVPAGQHVALQQDSSLTVPVEHSVAMWMDVGVSSAEMPMVEWKGSAHTYCSKDFGSVPVEEDERLGFGLSEKQCRERCERTPMCNAYTYGKWTKCCQYMNKMRCQMYQHCETAPLKHMTLFVKVNRCLCADGVAATKDACAANGAHICTSCHAGFTLMGSVCRANQCKCAGGQAATGSSCLVHGAMLCSSCHAGFNLVDGTCRANHCTCDNGRAATGALCEQDGAAICTSCHTGYALSGNMCMANRCQCTGGTPALGASCAMNGETVCVNCHPGFTHWGDLCKANACTCNYGVAATGVACSTDGAAICESCSLGFTHNGGLCEVAPVPAIALAALAVAGALLRSSLLRHRGVETKARGKVSVQPGAEKTATSSDTSRAKLCMRMQKQHPKLSFGAQ